MKKLTALLLCLCFVLLSFGMAEETELGLSAEANSYLQDVERRFLTDTEESYRALDQTLALISEDRAEAVQICTEKAEAGDAEAQCILGEMYMCGYVVPLDLEKALEWTQKAVQQDIPRAKSNLALLCLYGHVVERDLDKAFELMCEAAEQGYDYAQAMLGVFYELGLGTEPDSEKAFEWYTKSAEQGQHLGMLYLGKAYFKGTGSKSTTRKFSIGSRRLQSLAIQQLCAIWQRCITTATV